MTLDGVVDFDSAFVRLLGNEGRFSMHSQDPGNWSSGKAGVGTLEGTMWGISAPVARASGYFGPMQNMPQTTAKMIYMKEYWTVAGCDQFNRAIAWLLFDAAVNFSPRQAIIFLQHAANVKEDGALGAQTIGAVRSTSLPRLGARFLAARLRAHAKSPNDVFNDGWMNRIATDLDYFADDI